MKEKLLILTAFTVFCLTLYISVIKAENNIVNVIAESDNQYDITVIVDAGHGGEDSGAVAFDNTYEKEINLSITKKITLLFDIFGINYVSLRNSDVALGDASFPTVRERKVSDIYKRFEIINSYNNSVLLSIHQNFFPLENYSGTQVFYSDSEEAEIIAQCIQNKIVKMLQNTNTRKIKKTSKDIYLLDKAIRPSVMVECGFMSNNLELSLLKDKIYQQKMSYLITRGMMNYLYQKFLNNKS